MDAEMTVFCAENAHLSKVSSFMLGVGQNIALHTLPAAINISFLISIFQVRSTTFCSKFLFEYKMAYVRSNGSDLNSWFYELWCWCLLCDSRNVVFMFVLWFYELWCWCLSCDSMNCGVDVCLVILWAVVLIFVLWFYGVDVCLVILWTVVFMFVLICPYWV